MKDFLKMSIEIVFSFNRCNGHVNRYLARFSISNFTN